MVVIVVAVAVAVGVVVVVVVVSSSSSNSSIDFALHNNLLPSVFYQLPPRSSKPY